MLRAAMALLLCISCWEPAMAGAVAQVVVSRSASSPVVPLLSAGLPGSGLTGVSLSGLKASLTGGLSSTLSPAPSVLPAPAVTADVMAGPAAAGTPILVPVSQVLPSAPAAVPTLLPESVRKAEPALTAVSQVSTELSRTAAPAGGSASASAPVQSPVLNRLYDGGIKTGLLADPIDATMSIGAVALAPLQKGEAKAEVKAQVPAAAAAEAAKKKASKQALIGSAIYKFGMESVGITMPLIALTFFGSAVWMASFAVVWGISMTVASMLAGGLLDRRPVQKVIAGALVTQAIAVGGIITLLALGIVNPWFVLPLYSLAGFTQGVVLTARDTLPARILGRDHAVLSKFNAKMHMVYEIAGTVAPMLVGLMIGKVALLAGLFILPPAYLLAALAFSRIKLDPAMDHSDAQPFPGIKEFLKRTVADVREGSHVMMGSKEFRWLSFMMLAPMVLHRIVEQMLTPLFAKSVLHAPAMAAWIVSGSNLGELLGAVFLLSTIMNKEGGKKPSPFRWIRMMALAGLGVWAYLTGALWLVVPTVVVMGLTFSANDIGVSSYIQSRLPNESSGKAMGFLMAVELGSIMAISYLMGFLFDLLPVGAALAAVAVAFSLMALVFFKGYGKLKASQKPKA
jgi:MFS family permease